MCHRIKRRLSNGLDCLKGHRYTNHQFTMIHRSNFRSKSSSSNHSFTFFLCFSTISIYFCAPFLTLSMVSAASIKSGVTIKSPSVNSQNSTLYIIYTSTAMYQNWTIDCPCRVCGISNRTGLREIICDTGSMYHLPIYKIPPHIEFIEIRGKPPDKLNNLTLGPLFYRFPELKVLRVLYSNVPAIGQTTFRYKTSLVELDLSHNVIRHLIDANFKGLRNLEMLNLSHNLLGDLTSAPFQHLISLRILNLSHNRMKTITTRLFYNLSNLESLDLSHNPISEITPQNTIDLRPLRRMYMSHARLKELHSLFYRNVPNLELLDLRYNQITALHKHEFRHLPNLTELYLDGNRLIVLPSSVFFGNSLNRLGLSHNLLVQLHSDAFLNATIIELDLSDNNFTNFDANTFVPLASCLKLVNLSNVKSLADPANAVARLISPLTVLEQVILSNMSLSSSLPSDMFEKHRKSLRVIDLSHNQLDTLAPKLVENMYSLEVLDLSHNAFFEDRDEFLTSLTDYTNLTHIYLDHNPWRCYRCHLLSFRSWITATDRPINAYTNVCQRQNRCAECVDPPMLAGVQVDKMEEYQLEWCTDPTVELRVSTTEPNVGLVLALLIIIILIIVIVGVIVYYRNRGAIYFTNEELFYGRSPGSLGPPGSVDTEPEKSNGSTVYNMSSRIRQFVNATQSPPDSGGHSVRSSSAESLDRTSSVKKPNGHTKSQHEPIMNPIVNGNHRDSTNTNESSIRSNGGFSKPGQTATILRRPKKQASSVSSTSSKGGATRGVSYDDENGSGSSHNHYERPPTSRYRILKPKSSSKSDEEEEEKEPKIKRPIPPPLPPLVPRGAKPKKMVSMATVTLSPKKTPSKISVSSSSSSESKASTQQSKSESESESSDNDDHGSSSRPRSLPSTLRPYDESARSSAEVEEVEDDEDSGSGASSPETEHRRTQRRSRDSSPDSSTQALAEGGSTSPSSTRSSDFTRSPVND